MCSLNTVFDLICENPYAQVPDLYYKTLGNMDLVTSDLATSDLVILSCQEVASMFRKYKPQLKHTL